jgi:hypothetical protein
MKDNLKRKSPWIVLIILVLIMLLIGIFWRGN